MHAPFSDPDGTLGPGHSGAALLIGSRVLPSAVSKASAPVNRLISRLHRAACMLAVYASQPRSPSDHARLASGWWPTLAGRDSNPLGPGVKFQPYPLHGILLTQALPGAPKHESQQARRIEPDPLMAPVRDSGKRSRLVRSSRRLCHPSPGPSNARCRLDDASTISLPDKEPKPNRAAPIGIGGTTWRCTESRVGGVPREPHWTRCPTFVTIKYERGGFSCPLQCNV